MTTLALLAFFLSMDLTLTTLLIQPMKVDMALSDVQIGLLQGTVFGVTFGIASLPMGRLIDRRPRVTMLLVGLAIWIGAMTATALATGTTMLFAARAALGIVAAILIPSALSLIADLYPPERRSVATSLFVVGQASGQAFGILAGGLAFDALTRAVTAHQIALPLAPWRALYLAAALLGLVPLALLLATREPARQEQRGVAADLSTALRELWSWRGFLAPLLLAMLFVQITMQATSVWSAPVLIRRYRVSPGAFAGWLSAITLGGGILGALGGGRLGELGRRTGSRARVLLPALGASLAIAPLSLYPIMPGVPLFATLLALDLVAAAMVATLGVVAITLNIPNELRGLALGANVFLSTMFGTALASPAIALVSRALGGEQRLDAGIVAVSVPSALLAALCFALAMRARTTVRDGALQAVAVNN